MKNLIPAALLATVLFACSCKKDNTNTGPGTLTYQGTTYHFTASMTYLGGLTAYMANYSAPALMVSFGAGNTLPTTSGTWIVNGDSMVTGYVDVQLNITNGPSGPTGDLYESTGGNGSNQSVKITVSGGKLSVSGTNIEMLDQYTGIDSFPITFNISQE